MKKIQTFQRAIHAFDRGELDTAKQLANELLTRQPNHPPVMTLLGKIYFEENDYAKSTLYLCESIKINPEESHNHFMLAKAYNAQRQPNKAITSLQQVLLLEPQHIEANILLANLFKDRGDVELAKKHVTRVLDNDPEHQFALQICKAVGINR
jgi:predicted Zn-dependent protease